MKIGDCPYFPALALCMLLALLAQSEAAGSRFYVSARSGDDAAGGRSGEAAFKTLGRAFEEVRGGDTLIVMPGEYYTAPLVIADLESSPENPVWILAEPRGQATISAAWPEAAVGEVKWTDEGGGIWSAPHGPMLFGSWDGRFLFRYMSVADLKAAEVETRGSYGRVKGPTSGFAWEGDRIYVKLPGGADPNGERLIFSPPSWGEPTYTPVVRVHNSPGLIFDGLRIQASGTYGIGFDAASTHPIVRNCIFEYCRAALRLPSHSLVEWCEYTFPGFHAFSEEVRRRNGGRIVTYPLVKDYHPSNWYEGGIASAAGQTEHPPVGCEFRYNFMHEVFDGETLGQFDDSESHHNVYLHCHDNCVELEGWQEGYGSRNLRFHHNLLLGCPLGAISHQNPTELVGPHYVYRNVVYGYDDYGWNPWTLIKSKCYEKGRGFYYYHNLFWVESAQPYWNERGWPQDWLATFDFRNNIFVFTSRLKRPAGPPSALESFRAAGNILMAPQADAQTAQSFTRNGGRWFRNLDELHLRDPASLDFALEPGSPAIDAGVSIAGFNDNARGAPDIGPFELGEE
ncbi:MAG: hypothetical protein KAX19_07245, partial [Candidatus Brocadiae bacterium]|nr:hypothetical protein [Candidatus Brocadiia bacterium]